VAILFKGPSAVGQEYLEQLKALKPEVDIKRTDSDWYIRSRVVGGVVSGAYADQRKIADDSFPQSARREALEKHLIKYFGAGFNQATKANGSVGVTGTIGSSLTISTQFLYEPNGNTYEATQTVVLSDAIGGGNASGVVAVSSINTGQAQNLISGASLTISSPPAGITSPGISTTDISDGKDIESNEEASARILNRVQMPPAGGTANDYKNFAKEANASVSDANIIRFIYGLGTIGIVITAGTTDIDTAVTNGDPVVRVPSSALITQVQDYVDSVKVLTDCVYILTPSVVTLDVTARVRYATGNNLTIPDGQTLTQKELVQREIKRAIYKTPPGGRRFGSSGFVVLSEVEEVLDQGLSAQPYSVGNFAEILVDRQVDNLSATGINLYVGSQDIIEPGVIQVVEL